MVTPAGRNELRQLRSGMKPSEMMGGFFLVRDSMGRFSFDQKCPWEFPEISWVNGTEFSD